MFELSLSIIFFILKSCILIIASGKVSIFSISKILFSIKSFFNSSVGQVILYNFFFELIHKFFLKNLI